MYQQNKRFKLFYLENPEKEFEKLIKIFKEESKLNIELNKSEIEFDLSKMYCPNHACIWNKIKNIDRKGYIVQKNNELALLVFPNDMKITLDKFYRLEDLTLTTNNQNNE